MFVLRGIKLNGVQGSLLPVFRTLRFQIVKIRTTHPKGAAGVHHQARAASCPVAPNVTDADGNVTRYAYDADSRLVTETDPLGHSTTYAYDADSEVVGITDRDGRQTSYTYNAAGEETSENWLNSSGVSIYTITYAYDNASRLTSVSDPDATYAYTYDASSRLTTVDNAGTPGVPHVVLTMGYNAVDDRTSVSDNLGGTTTYAYNNAHEMTSVGIAAASLAAWPQVTLGYDNDQRLTSINRSESVGGCSGGSGGSGGGSPACVNTAIGYDAAGRVTSISHAANSNTLASYNLTWDAASQLTQEVSKDGTENYTYDPDGELTSATGWRSES